MGRSSVHLFSYIAREFFLSFIVAFLFFFFIFFVNQILLLAEEILRKKVAVFDVILLIIYSLPAIVAFSFPFGALVGALMAIGRLSSDNEILAMQALGVSLSSVFVPLIALGLLFSVVSFVVNDYYLPLGTLNFGKLYRRILFSNPELELESFSVKRYQDSIIVTGKVEERKISDLIIFDETAERENRIITAKSAYLSERNDQPGVITLQLESVFGQLVDPKDSREFEYFTSEEMEYNILLKDISLSVKNLSPREMSSVDVYKGIVEKREVLRSRIEDQEEEVRRERLHMSLLYRSSVGADQDRERIKYLNRIQADIKEYERLRDKNVSDRTLKIWEIEFFKKSAIPFGCFVFVFFAFPVGLFSKRSGRSVGFGIGLFVALFYWGLLFAGQTLGLREEIPASLSMWAPNLVIFLLGLFFLILRLRR